MTPRPGHYADAADTGELAADEPVPYLLTAAAWRALATRPIDQPPGELAAGPPPQLPPLFCGETRSTP